MLPDDGDGLAPIAFVVGLQPLPQHRFELHTLVIAQLAVRPRHRDLDPESAVAVRELADEFVALMAPLLGEALAHPPTTTFRNCGGMA